MALKNGIISGNVSAIDVRNCLDAPFTSVGALCGGNASVAKKLICGRNTSQLGIISQGNKTGLPNGGRPNLGIVGSMCRDHPLGLRIC